MSEQCAPVAKTTTAGEQNSFLSSRSILNPNVADHKQGSKPKPVRKGARPFTLFGYTENWGVPTGEGAPR